MRRKFYKLQRRLEDCDISNDLLAVKLRMTLPTLRSRLNGTQSWKSDEIILICQLADIRQDQVGEFFFPDLEPVVINIKGGKTA
ncbi:MAG: DUF739 family protein [Oscillospiraceae bacterium]|nr:DUF739 family protein [Oscillospiraceae bacterium]